MGGKNARDRSTKLDPVVICISVDDGDDREERERERFNTRGEILKQQFRVLTFRVHTFHGTLFQTLNLTHNRRKHKRV